MLILAALGLLSTSDTALGRALNAPPLRKVELDRLDDAGTEYVAQQGLAPTGGLVVLAGWGLFNRVLRPTLEARARERQAAANEAMADAEREAESAEPPPE